MTVLATRVVTLATCVCLMLASAAAAAGQDGTGRVRGRLVRTSGDGIDAATATLHGNGPSRAALTSPTGEFTFDRVAPGTYSITLTLRDDSIDIASVIVTAGEETAVERTVDWPITFRDAVTVVGPSRTTNRIDEAPASVSRLDALSIAEQATHHDVARTVQFMEGVQITQGGLYDYNVNTRGFNSSLNRRVAVLIDGRSSADGFFDAQEWASLGMPLDTIASIEMVRGPSAALYGANASSGVMVITTKDPDAEPGGLVRLTFGELNTRGLEARWAGRLSDRWSASVLGSARLEGDFFRSRRTEAEYSTLCETPESINCLARDVGDPLRNSDNEIFFGSARVDRTFDGSLPLLGGGQRLTLEAGLTHLSGPVQQTGVGRGQSDGVKRPWARVALRADHARFQFSYTGRRAPRQRTLTSGTTATLNSRAFQVDGQLDHSFANDRIRAVGGASASTQRVDSFSDMLERQTAVLAPVFASKQAVFGEVGVAATGQLRLVAAARADFSSLHDAQVSPRLAAIYTPAPRHSVRVTFSRAFQVPNLSEFFLYTDARPAVDLSQVNAVCLQAGFDCGLTSNVRVLAVGNRDLDLEKTWTIEAGYRAIVGRRSRLTVDYYRSRSSNFITDLIDQLEATLGPVNDDYGPWQAPPGVPQSIAAAVRAAVPPILSNGPNGEAVFIARSYTNFGRVDSQGVDTAFETLLPGGWRAMAGYSWFDHDLGQTTASLERIITPNAPRHTVMAGTGYRYGRLSADLSLRWVDTFRWSVGPYVGYVETYTNTDLSANYRLLDHVTLSAHVANLFDDEHWESFGGDLLRRRALASIAYGW